MESLPGWVYSLAGGLAVGGPIWVFIFRQHVETLKARISHLEAVSAPELARQIKELTSSLDEATGKVSALAEKAQQEKDDKIEKDAVSFRAGIRLGVASALTEFVRLVRWAVYSIEHGGKTITVPRLLRTILETLRRFIDLTLDALAKGEQPLLPSLDLREPNEPWNR